MNPTAFKQIIRNRAKAGAKLKIVWFLAVFLSVLLLAIAGIQYYLLNPEHSDNASQTNIQLDILPSDDPQAFMLASAAAVRLKISLKPVPGGQWEVSIPEAGQKVLDHWLDYLGHHGFRVQSLRVLNLAEQGKVTVPLIRLMKD